MKDDERPRSIWEDALLAEARALALTVAAVRRARGKANPEDFSADTAEWRRIAEDFARDVLRVLECNSAWLGKRLDIVHREIDDDYLGIGAAG